MSSAAPAEAVEPVRPKRTLLTWARYIAGIALGALAFWAVAGQRGELTGATSALASLDYPWLIFAIASELGSVVAFSRMQAHLLKAAGGEMPTGRILGVTFAAGAIASSIPAGPAISSVYAYRQYRRYGSDEATALWTLFATLVSSALGLVLFALVGVFVAQEQGTAFIGTVVAVLAIVLAIGAALWQRRLVFVVVRGAIRLSQPVLKRFGRDADEIVTRLRSNLGHVRLTWRDFLPALAWSIASWLCDWGALVLGYAAVDATVPWRGIVFAYGIGQLAQNLPITPGGLGVVEGSLTIALVAYGGGQVSTVAAVLLYRIVSFWGYLPVAWSVWGFMTIRDRRRDRARRLPSQERMRSEGLT